ncbi:LAME_0D08900g1_1 [Lachancea meyersii CBS 8951]|uniref:LAME_0D08900g1_1 n=1 Tax=Lachancea meyersii CBS 8951 TaxID=1266667 RepID=A0A1G4JAS0_9SACH|nr:LAME_0D08900g1_1 [Lachancea meyersii CBS 8951]
MAGKSPMKTDAMAGKQPSNLKTLKNRNVGGKSAPVLAHSAFNSRPRRFSLIYSSDSSLSALSDLDNNREVSNKIPKMSKKSKRGVANEMGKNGRLIPENAVDSNSESSSDSGAIDDESDSPGSSSEDDGNDRDDEEDVEDGQNDLSSSTSSSDDDDVDFVKLSAERKKRAMRAMSALKRGKSPKKSDIATKDIKKTVQDVKNNKKDSFSGESSYEDAMAFTFKNDGGIKFGKKPKEAASDEDLGEEVNDGSSASNHSISAENNAVDTLNVPQISESEESDYEIDHDAYLKSIQHDEEDILGLENGMDTGEDDVPILDEEENHIVMELEKDDELSFNGSIHEEGEDPVEVEAKKGLGAKFSSQAYSEYNDDDEDENMSDFDEPFYEDPKFANLYYCAGSDQPLSLSTSLPLILDDEKKRNHDKKQIKKREREEFIRRRKLARKLDKERRQRSAATDLDNEEYLFGVYFKSDEEKNNIEGIESSLRQLGSAAASDSYSSEEEYENILLDIAHIPTDEESLTSSIGGLKGGDCDAGDDVEEDDDEDDDVSMSHVFIDIDDLDPDSFYFQYDSSDDEELDVNSESNQKAEPGRETESGDKDYVETVVYIDGESTDEDETLPPPNTRNKKIGSKAKEVVSANVVGLKPPKLGTWETDNKPFSIIDGLSTKSLYPLLQEQQLLEQSQLLQQPMSASELSATGEKEELTLNELLNMSELDDEDEASRTANNNLAVSEWYEKPKVPLSAFRNKGVDVGHDEEYMLPVFSARKCPIGYVGSERTRKKIDRMKILQKKKSEERRKLKKKKKLLKLKKERDRLEKERLSEVAASSEIGGADLAVSLKTEDPLSVLEKRLEQETNSEVNTSNKSIDAMGLDDINNLLANTDNDLIPHAGQDGDRLDAEDADILATLTAPVDVDATDDGHITTGAAWRRRQSVVEAAAENLRFTKSGLFSESALADLEEIIGGSSASVIEFSDVLQ